MKRRTVAVSFDALDTLITVDGGVGHQYHRHFCDFLARHQVDAARELPALTEASVAKSALAALKVHMTEVRERWRARQEEEMLKQQQQQQQPQEHKADEAAADSTREDGKKSVSVNPREAPLGANCDAVDKFWDDVIRSTFTAAPLYEGCEASVRRRLEALLPPPPSTAGVEEKEEPAEWRQFTDHLSLGVFGSGAPYAWLPESRRTLLELRRWAARQELAAARAGASTPEGEAVKVLSPFAPFILTNSDIRMFRSLRDLLPLLEAEAAGAGESAAIAARPLLGDMLSSQQLGRAKPSPVGLREVARRAGLQDMRCLVHVGDSADDAAACAAAGCHYLQCDETTGVRWESLLEVLESI